MKRLVSVSAWLASCCLASAVHAASVSASLSGLVFTLTDLDPDDGVAPSITWVSSLSTGYASSQSGMVVVWDDLEQGLWHPEYSQIAPEAFELDDVTPWAALTVNAGAAQAVLTAHSLVANHVVPPQGGVGAANASVFLGFELSPMTRLTLTGQFNINLQAPGGTLAALPVGSHPGVYVPFAALSAYVDAGLEVSSSTASAGLTFWTDAEFMDLSNHTVSTDPLGQTGALSYALGRSFTHELVNDGATAMSGSFRAMAAVSGSQLAAVPEPATIGLVMGGLMVCAWQMRRRGATHA